MRKCVLKLYFCTKDLREIWKPMHLYDMLFIFIDSYYCCSRDPDSRAHIYVQSWEIGWWNYNSGLALQEGHTNVRNVFLPFQQGSHFLVSWSQSDHKVSPSWPAAIKPMSLDSLQFASTQSGGWGFISTPLCPQFQHFKKNSNSTQLILGLQSRWNLYNTMIRQQSSSLSSSLSPCRSSGNYFRTLFQKTIEGFDCKINAMMAKLLGQRSCTAWAGQTTA